MSRGFRIFLIAIACLATFVSRAQTPAATPAQTGAAGLFQDGQRALQSGDLDAAQQAFRQVLKADPRSGAAYANLGVIAMRRKDWDAALSLLQRAQRLEPKMAGVRLNIGLVKYRRGDYV